MKPVSRLHPANAFSLVELSVVLVIMSLIMGSVLTVMANRSQQAKIKETEEKMRQIEQAVGVFLIENRRLPCPAHNSISQNNTLFGREDVACSFNPGGVPTKTLQLPDDYAFDAWGRRIAYHVALSCVSAANFRVSATCPGDYGLEVYSAAGTSNTLDAVLVMASHGPNGFGAWPHNGGKKKIKLGTAGPEELENANDDIVYVQRSPASNFDDIVHYTTKPLLIQRSGGLVGNGGNAIPPANISPLCAIVTNRITSNADALSVCGSGNATCADALWSASGTGVAAQVSALCF